ncbi:LTA synthase family protein [Sphaerisporangium corydalis]|uniref:Sulfatase n=1 Tax=Sphaerisporangium corydalis TaxID=1441875 RepID=A0ABV9EIE9_9ACTN|nr:sulfatase [Sphaerisporangium corydalis]
MAAESDLPAGDPAVDDTREPLPDDTREPLPDDATPGDEGEPAVGVRTGRRVAGRVVTVLACLFVLFALIAPNNLSHLTPGAFVRVPLEAMLGAALVLVLPAWARRWVAVPVGVVLGLLAIVKLTDMGFYEVLDRPFDPLIDWTFLGAGVEFLTTSIGRVGAIGTVVGVGLLAIAVLVLMTLSIMRLSRLVVRHRTPATAAVVVLQVVWVGCAAFGAQIVPGTPVAALAYDRLLQQVRASLQDQKAFAAEVAVDAFRDTPGQDLLTGLRGKDVVLAFVESYGRDAIEDPEFAPQVDAVLDAGTARLRAAGFASRSAFLTSPTAGGGSWLAHSTLLSGVWIDNQQRYNDLVASKRLTLNDAFRRANWRTVGIMPGVTREWPEGKFYGYDQIYAAKDLGYHGPRFNWGTMPDQFTLSSFQRSERDKKDRAPVMAEIPLVSSHAPWAPIPQMIDWKNVGDGSVFGPMPATGNQPDAVWSDFRRVRTEYRRSIEYSLNSLISYVETYGDDNLVLVFLGDHQPAQLVTGAGAVREVPITIVARDKAVLDRISGWGWQDGLKPGPKSPVWPMNSFRDRFLTAFGPQPQATPSPAPPQTTAARQPEGSPSPR